MKLSPVLCLLLLFIGPLKASPDNSENDYHNEHNRHYKKKRTHYKFVPSIEKLPPEIVVNVLNYLVGTDFINVRKCCKYFHALTYDKSLLPPVAHEDFLKFSTLYPANKSSILRVNPKQTIEKINNLEVSYKYNYDDNLTYRDHLYQKKLEHWKIRFCLLNLGVDCFPDVFKNNYINLLDDICYSIKNARYLVPGIEQYSNSELLLNEEKKIRVGYWEILALVDERAKITLSAAYRKGECIPLDIERAVFWDHYKTPFNSPTIALLYSLTNYPFKSESLADITF